MGQLREGTDRAWVVVDLDRIRENMRQMAASLPEKTKIIGVVKADGYGHGAEPVAKAIDAWVWGYAVATADEALSLRREGIRKPILILGSVREERFRELLAADIRPVLFTRREAEAFAALASQAGIRGKAHLALDTGMSRIGFRPGEEAAAEAERLYRLPGLAIEGIFTHFARADEEDKTSAREQYRLFQEFLSRLSFRSSLICHCSNSAAILDRLAIGEETAMDGVRAGIAIYGLYPSDQVGREAVKLQPALEFKSRITYVKEIGPGTAVSYGGLFRAEGPVQVATVSTGYADGYPRSLSGKGEVLIRGKRARILGRICMDQFMVDVSHIPEARPWDVVTLIGRDGEEEITVEEVAALCGGFHYELPCLITKRVPRVYLSAHRQPVPAI